MSDVTGILGSIDGALRDCTVSADAMRWQPEGSPPRPSGSVFAVSPGGSLGRVAWHDLAGASIVLGRPFELAAAERRAGPPLRPLPEFSGTFTGEFSPGALERLTRAAAPTLAEAEGEARDAFLEAWAPVTAWATEACRLIAEFGRQVSEGLAPVFRLAAATLAVTGEADRQRERDGKVMRREYRRRQLARRRRRR